MKEDDTMEVEIPKTHKKCRTIYFVNPRFYYWLKKQAMENGMGIGQWLQTLFEEQGLYVEPDED